MTGSRSQSPEDRVANASQEAYELALDALHDSHLREALFRRLDRPPLADPATTNLPSCLTCDKPATWVRATQFAGKHPFCTLHARAEPDFGAESSTVFWYETSKSDAC